MPEYVLAVDKPHLSVDGLGVIYKRTQVEREFENDNDAISWGRFAARDDLSFPLAGIPHLARPITLWRVTPQEVVVLWGDAQITSPKPKRVTLDQMPVDTPADFARLLRWM